VRKIVPAGQDRLGSNVEVLLPTGGNRFSRELEGVGAAGFRWTALVRMKVMGVWGKALMVEVPERGTPTVRKNETFVLGGTKIK